MYRDHTVGVVLPAYNEAAHVGSVIDSLPAFVDRLYAIDDASTDETWAVIRAHTSDDSPPTQPRGADLGAGAVAADGSGAGGPVVVPVSHPVNRGAGGALKTGYALAERDGIDITVTLDADSQMDPAAMASLLDPLVEGRAGYAAGNRLADRESADAMPPFRLLGNWLLTLLTRPASGYWRLRDPQNGYTAISLTALRSVDLAAIPDGHDYTNDLLARLNAAGVGVADVPMAAIYGDEESTISFAEFVPRTTVTICRAFVWRLRQGGTTLSLLYGLGLLGIALGVVSLGGVIRQAVQPLLERLPNTVTLFALGIVATLAAVLLDSDDEGQVVTE